jgi:hypothetical protein
MPRVKPQIKYPAGEYIHIVADAPVFDRPCEKVYVLLHRFGQALDAIKVPLVRKQMTLSIPIDLPDPKFKKSGSMSDTQSADLFKLDVDVQQSLIQNEQINERAEHLYGGGVPRGPFMYNDLQWEACYRKAAIYPLEQWDARMRFTFRTAPFHGDNRIKVARKFVHDTIGMLAANESTYSVAVTCSFHTHDSAGMAYDISGSLVTQVRPEFVVERDAWTALGPARRKKVLGMYPGLFLTSWHLDQLGGKEAFLSEFRTNFKFMPNLHEFYIDFGSAGLYFQVMRNVMELSEHNPGGSGPVYFQLAGWFWRKLRAADLFTF